MGSKSYFVLGMLRLKNKAIKCMPKKSDKIKFLVQLSNPVHG